MKTKKFSPLLPLLILFLFLLNSHILATNQKPLTVAESSGFTATSRYNDVIEFIRKLQKQSSLIKVESLCTSAEGRDVPLLVVGRPVPSSPLDLKYSNRAVIYIQANIHAGEVEGKEASLMLIRDILLENNVPFLDNLVILAAPIFNPDGNEKISLENRRSQNGPREGVGVRYNGQNLDLNRDAMKLESPEVRGLVQNVLNRWDPVLLVDCHTTDGSYHEEPVTYVWGLNPNGDSAIIEYMRSKMMPLIAKNLRGKYKVLSIPYGNFIDPANPEKGWRPAGPQPRFITNYVGLRNRLSILDENYTHADFKTRVWGAYYFLRSILEYCDKHKDEILQLVKTADQKTIQRGMCPSKKDSFAVDYDLEPLKDKITILGYKMNVIQRKGSWPIVKKTAQKKIYKLPYFCDYVPRKSVRFPYGYLVPLPVPEIEKKLLQHGITVEKLTESATLEVESFVLKEVKASERLFQGHHLNSVKGKYVVEKKDFPPGTLFVSTAQPLANVAAYLLEPESDDGLIAWNFFDRYLFREWRREPENCPIYKLLEPAKLAKETVK